MAGKSAISEARFKSAPSAMRQRFASKPPPAVAFMGRFGFEALGCFAVRFLGRVRELHDVLEFLCLVEFQRQRRDRDTASVGSVNRPGLVT